MTITSFTHLALDPAILMTATITTTEDFDLTDEDDGHLDCDHDNGVYHCDSC